MTDQSLIADLGAMVECHQCCDGEGQMSGKLTGLLNIA